MILVIVGIVLYAAIFLISLSFFKIAARADRNMKIIWYREFSISNFVGQNLLNPPTEDKNSELWSMPQSSLLLPTRSPLVEP